MGAKAHCRGACLCRGPLGWGREICTRTCTREASFVTLAESSSEAHAFRTNTAPCNTALHCSYLCHELGSHVERVFR